MLSCPDNQGAFPEEKLVHREQEPWSSVPTPTPLPTTTAHLRGQHQSLGLELVEGLPNVLIRTINNLEKRCKNSTVSTPTLPHHIHIHTYTVAKPVGTDSDNIV